MSQPEDDSSGISIGAVSGGSKAGGCTARLLPRRYDSKPIGFNKLGYVGAFCRPSMSRGFDRYAVIS